MGKKRGRKPAMDQEMIDDAIWLIDLGYSVGDVAFNFDISPCTVVRYLPDVCRAIKGRASVIKPDGRKRKGSERSFTAEENRTAAIKMYTEEPDINMTIIAERLGVTKERVRQYLRDAEVPSKAQGTEYRRIASLPSEVKVLAALDKADGSITGAAKIIGCGTTSINKILNGQQVRGYWERRREKLISSDRVRTAVSDYVDKGIPSTEVAKKHGVTASTILKWVRISGRETRIEGSQRGVTYPDDECI